MGSPSSGEIYRAARNNVRNLTHKAANWWPFSRDCTCKSHAAKLERKMNPENGENSNRRASFEDCSTYTSSLSSHLHTGNDDMNSGWHVGIRKHDEIGVKRLSSALSHDCCSFFAFIFGIAVRCVFIWLTYVRLGQFIFYCTACTFYGLAIEFASMAGFTVVNGLETWAVASPARLLQFISFPRIPDEIAIHQTPPG